MRSRSSWHDRSRRGTSQRRGIECETSSCGGTLPTSIGPVGKDFLEQEAVWVINVVAIYSKCRSLNNILPYVPLPDVSIRVAGAVATGKLRIIHAGCR